MAETLSLLSGKKMKRTKYSELDVSLTSRFILPVIAENLFTVLIGLLIAQVNSTISKSALAAIGMSNSVMSVIMALFSMLMTGSAVLANRRIGEGDAAGAAEVVEQSMFLGLVSSAGVTILAIISASVILRLLMPTAEDALFGEAVTYYRILMLSLPGYVIHGLLSSLSRAMGNSRSPLIAAICMNIGQVVFAWIFITWLKLDEVGAGLAYIGCRLIGTGIMMAVIWGKHAQIPVIFRNIVRPKKDLCTQILRIGIPVSLESLFVQLGYMLANSMSIGLGTFEGSVYQIMNTLNNFATVPQGICSVIAMTAVGHLLGAGHEKDSRKAGRLIWCCGMAASILLAGFNMLSAKWTGGFYTTDPETLNAVSSGMWILLVMNIAGISINCVDPQIRAGGDVKFIMMNSLIAVWAIRLPLTYVFSYILDWGVVGIYAANAVSLYVRAAVGLIRKKGRKWIKRV